MATYALCGFANFSSIAIQIGGISPIAPNQRKNLAELGIESSTWRYIGNFNDCNFSRDIILSREI